MAHTVALPGAGEETIHLRYGGLGGATHETTLFRGETEGPVEAVLSGVDSLYVGGDIHGEFDRLRRLLENGGLIDDDGAWTGGSRHVVFLGDIFDRGPDVTRTLWFLYQLERDARATGGGAHVVLGNHETMIFTDDIRYVSPKESLVAQLHGVPYGELFDIRTSVLGRWLADRPVVMWVDGVLLAHGGIGPEVQPRSIEALNDSIRSFMAEDLFYLWSDTTMALVTDPEVAVLVAGDYDRVIQMDSAAAARRMEAIFRENSILWYRAYVESDTLEADLDRALEDFEALLHVVGHTPVETVSVRYGGKLFAVDLLEPATEMLLLTRDPDVAEPRAWRIGLEGDPEPLAPGS
jgi:hypothetical protein